MKANWLVASAMLLLSIYAQAASPVDGLNDNPSFRLAFALDPVAEPIGYSVLNGNAYKLESGIRTGSTRDEIAAIFLPPERYAQASPMQIAANIFEKQSDVDEDGITIDSPGALYSITSEFDADDRVSKVSISVSKD